MKKLLAAVLLLTGSLFAQPLNFVNKYQSTLASGYTSGATTATITSGTGLPSGACYFYMIVRAEGVNTEETWLVTNRSGTTLTLTGAQSGTSASNHASGATILASIMTAEAFTQLKTDILSAAGIAITSNAVPKGTGTTLVASGCKIDSSNNLVCNSVGSGDASQSGAVALVGKTSGNTVTIKVADATATGTLTAPGKTGTVSYVASAGTSGHCVQYDTDGVGTTDAGGACGITTPGMVLLEQHTASSSSSLDFPSCISSSYDIYHVEVVGLRTATNAVLVGMRFSTDGGSTYDSGTNYSWESFVAVRNTQGPNGADAATTMELVNETRSATSTYSMDGWFNFYHPASSGSLWLQATGQFQTIINASPAPAVWTFGGSYTATPGAVNAFRILASSGNLASGTVRCYGIAK